MRVLHVIPGIARRYGGPSTAIGPMCAALNRLPGISTEIATTDADGPGGRIDSDALAADVATHVFRRTASESWKFSGGLWKWLRQHAGDYNLIHVHALWSFAAAAAGAAARRARVPYIVRPAGMLSEYTWGRRAWKKRLYWALVERKTAFGAAGFHATSRAEAKEIEAARAGAKTFVIPQAVDAAAWTTPADPTALRRRLGALAADRPILLFLSRLHPKKGVTDLLLPALAQIKSDACLAIVGGPDSHAAGYEREIRQSIERLGLASRVGLLGPVAPEDRWALFDGAAAFVLPSHSENFGTVVTEAMARGCPVVVSDAVQAAEHVTAAGAGVVVPRAVEALAGALDELLTTPSLRAQLGEAGMRYTAARLTWDVVAKEILAMYQSCLSGVGRPLAIQGTSSA